LVSVAVTPRNFGLIDWESAHVGDPLVDVMRFLCYSYAYINKRPDERRPGEVDDVDHIRTFLTTWAARLGDEFTVGWQDDWRWVLRVFHITSMYRSLLRLARPDPGDATPRQNAAIDLRWYLSCGMSALRRDVVTGTYDYDDRDRAIIENDDVPSVAELMSLADTATEEGAPADTAGTHDTSWSSNPDNEYGRSVLGAARLAWERELRVASDAADMESAGGREVVGDGDLVEQVRLADSAGAHRMWNALRDSVSQLRAGHPLRSSHRVVSLDDRRCGAWALLGLNDYFGRRVAALPADEIPQTGTDVAAVLSWLSGAQVDGVGFGVPGHEHVAETLRSGAASAVLVCDELEAHVQSPSGAHTYLVVRFEDELGVELLRVEFDEQGDPIVTLFDPQAADGWVVQTQIAVFGPGGVAVEPAYDGTGELPAAPVGPRYPRMPDVTGAGPEGPDGASDAGDQQPGANGDPDDLRSDPAPDPAGVGESSPPSAWPNDEMPGDVGVPGAVEADGDGQVEQSGELEARPKFPLMG
jgi:hypothetical protein